MHNKGVLYGVGAYFIWGVFPIYWKWLQQVPATQILAHRLAWSFVLLVLIISARREWQPILSALRRPRTLLVFFVAACLLSTNWLIYIWGVNAGYIVETSLGYFINPLVSVLLGVIFLREKLRPAQWLPIGLAAAGVAYLAISYGSLPWIALALAFSFGLYGLVKKLSPLGSLRGLTVETGVLFVPTLAFLLVLAGRGAGAFGSLGLTQDLLMAGAGPVTTIPLLMFGAAAQSIPLSTLGLLQYIAPTCQFLVGVLIYHEPFTPARLVGFGIIWLALAIFTFEGFLARRNRSRL
ncbi:MAG: EamA family transporter RarD [Chloroflexota bacterium]